MHARIPGVFIRTFVAVAPCPLKSIIIFFQSPGHLALQHSCATTRPSHTRSAARFSLGMHTRPLCAHHAQVRATGPHVQGVLNLLDNRQADGGTLLVPRSYLGPSTPRGGARAKPWCLHRTRAHSKLTAV